MRRRIVRTRVAYEGAEDIPGGKRRTTRRSTTNSGGGTGPRAPRDRGLKIGSQEMRQEGVEGGGEGSRIRGIVNNEE